MTPLHTLLAATDLSQSARQAVIRAAMIAQDSGASLALLHVIENRGLPQLRDLFGEASSALTERLENDIRTELDMLAAEIGEPLGISVGQHLRSGNVLEEICNVADAMDTSLMVLGAHGAGFIRQILLGITAERLLRRALRPLLVVRRPATAAYRQVIVAVDFSAGSHTAIQFARAVAPQASLTLFHAFEIPFESRLRFAAVEESVLDQHRLKARQHATGEVNHVAAAAGLDAGDYHSLIAHGNAGLRLVEAERQLGADLIVVCKHGVSMTDELLLGSVTRHVLAEASCDVLVVR